MEKSDMQKLDLSTMRNLSGELMGYVRFGSSSPGELTSDEYATTQHASGERVSTYLLSLLQGGERILDVGCGVGATVNALNQAGFDAYGVDVPNLVPQWKKVENDPARFFCGDAVELPFADNTFDVVVSFGVIEHIGTVNGHCTMRDDYLEQRRAYAREIIRVTRPGGKIVIACPNKSFPLDAQHGVTDGLTQASPLRHFIYNKTGINVHKTWGRYHLPSYKEVRALFAGVRQFKPLPLKGYFGFVRFKGGFLGQIRNVAKGYVDNMPGFVAESCFNPYIMVMMEK